MNRRESAKSLIENDIWQMFFENDDLWKMSLKIDCFEKPCFGLLFVCWRSIVLRCLYLYFTGYSNSAWTQHRKYTQINRKMGWNSFKTVLVAPNPGLQSGSVGVICQVALCDRRVYIFAIKPRSTKPSIMLVGDLLFWPKCETVRGYFLFLWTLPGVDLDYISVFCLLDFIYGISTRC